MSNLIDEKQAQFIHDISNNILGMSGKIKKLKLLVDGDALKEINKLELICDKAIQRLNDYKDSLVNTNTK